MAAGGSATAQGTRRTRARRRTVRFRSAGSLAVNDCKGTRAGASTGVRNVWLVARGPGTGKKAPRVYIVRAAGDKDTHKLVETRSSNRSKRQL